MSTLKQLADKHEGATMKIRIAVVTDENGDWSACGFKDGDESDFHNFASDGLEGKLLRECWITADVPLPEPVAEVAGEVEG